MTPEQFAYWLQGFTELSPDMERPSAAQWQAIKDHLQTVFVKVTPPVLSQDELIKRFNEKIGSMPITIGSPPYPGIADRVVTC